MIERQTDPLNISKFVSGFEENSKDIEAHKGELEREIMAEQTSNDEIEAELKQNHSRLQNYKKLQRELENIEQQRFERLKNLEHLFSEIRQIKSEVSEWENHRTGLDEEYQKMMEQLDLQENYRELNRDLLQRRATLVDELKPLRDEIARARECVEAALDRVTQSTNQLQSLVTHYNNLAQQVDPDWLLRHNPDAEKLYEQIATSCDPQSEQLLGVNLGRLAREVDQCFADRRTELQKHRQHLADLHERIEATTLELSDWSRRIEECELQMENCKTETRHRIRTTKAALSRTEHEEERCLQNLCKINEGPKQELDRLKAEYGDKERICKEMRISYEMKCQECAKCIRQVTKLIENRFRSIKATLNQSSNSLRDMCVTVPEQVNNGTFHREFLARSYEHAQDLV